MLEVSSRPAERLAGSRAAAYYRRVSTRHKSDLAVPAFRGRLALSAPFPALLWPHSRHAKSSARFFPGGRYITLCGAGDAHGSHFRRAREWSVEQAFASDEFKHRVRQSDAAFGFHLGNQRTGAVAFHRDTRCGADGSEDAIEEVIILRVVLAAETDERFGSQLLQRDGFQPGQREV